MSKEITLPEYIQIVQDTIQFWLDIHTIPEKWAENWIIDEDIYYTFKQSPILKNNYFSFKWKEEALKVWCKDNKHLFNICRNCKSIAESGYDCCDNPKPGREPKLRDLVFWIEDCGISESMFTENQLMESLTTKGFKIYREGIKDIIAPVISECKSVLKSIQKAKNNQDILTAVLWGTRVFHVHGNIMTDYSERVNFDYDIYNLIDSIRNNGLNSVFSNEEIKEFLQEGV